MAQLASDFTTAATGILDAALVSAIASGIVNTNISGHDASCKLNNTNYNMNLMIYSDASRMSMYALQLVSPSNVDMTGTSYSNNFANMYTNTMQSFIIFNANYTAIIFCDVAMNYLGQVQFPITIDPGYTSLIVSCVWYSR